MEKQTPISTLGQFGLIDRIADSNKIRNHSTIKAIGDDAAVIDVGDRYMLLTSDLLMEGIHFDLTYFPLKHLGYKAVVIGISDILAMNARPEQLTVSLAVSSKISIEQIDELYRGIYAACEEYGVDLVGGDVTASINGLVISVSAAGSVAKERVAYRSGARPNDLICISGDMGSAFMGLHLLEREKRVLDGHSDPKPQFAGYEYLLRRQLQPYARLDVIESLETENIVPTAMIDISDGLASDILQICKSSDVGVKLFLDRIPIAGETYKFCDELHFDPVVAALNGGDDHELLFTVPIEQQQAVMRMGGIDIIGHIVSAPEIKVLVTPDGAEVGLSAQGFVRQPEEEQSAI